MKYKGTHINTRSGSVDLGGAAVNLNVNGQGSSQLHLSLGKLQKECVDIPKLINDSKGRLGKNTLIQFVYNYIYSIII